MSLRNKEGKKSSIRVSLYWVIGMAAGITAAIICSIVILSAKGIQPDWQGVALCFGGIGVFIAPALGFKAYQKRFEENENR